MWQGTAKVVLAAIAAAGGGVLNAQSELPAVRPESTAIGALIESGMARSATFRDLKTRLDNTDVIVYVRFSRCPSGIPACLAWITAGAGSRRLLIRIDRFDSSPDRLTALLAHELQHANEVAAAPDITDLASFERSFASLGWNDGTGFETEQAQNTTRSVAAELSRARHDAGRGQRPPP